MMVCRYPLNILVINTYCHFPTYIGRQKTYVFLIFLRSKKMVFIS